MSKKRDIDQLIAQAVQQGFRFERVPSGHWKAENPETLKHTHIPCTPKSTRGVYDARARLVKIGFVPTTPPKRKKREAKQVLQVVITDVKDAEMPKLGEIARVKSEKKELNEEFKDVVNPESVHKDIPMAAMVVWEAVQRRLQATPGGVDMERGGLPGKVWTGNRTRLMREIWHGIERRDQNRIGQYLNGSKNMSCLEEGRGHTTPIWWVSDEFFADMTEHQAKKTPRLWWKEQEEITDTGSPRVTAEDREVKVTAPVQTFGCTKCNYVALTAHGLATHKSKFKGREHARGYFPCNMCLSVLTTVGTLKQHCARRHPGATEYYCDACKAWLDRRTGPTSTEHAQKHAWDTRRKNSKPVEKPVEAEETQPWPREGSDYVTVPRETLETNTVTDAEAAIRSVLDELGGLRLAGEAYKREIEALKAENERLRDKMAENEKFIEGLRGFLK